MIKDSLVKHLKTRIQDEADFLEGCFLDEFVEVGEFATLWEVEGSISAGRSLCEVLEAIFPDELPAEEYLLIEESEETFRDAEKKLEGLKK